MHIEQDYLIVDAEQDLSGWEILLVENWNDLAVRIHQRRILPKRVEFRMIYCPKDIYNAYLQRLTPL